MTAEMATEKSQKRKFSDEQDNPKVLAPPPKKRMVVTPWRDICEFNGVFDTLISKNATISGREKALSRIRIWNLRRGSLCPAAVLATEVLVRAQLEDTQKSTIAQIVYANAFTRFFNFMSSIMQTFNMTSMYETAKQLGLQSFIVDLRHQCAHGQELPPVEVLRHTAEYCLDWLRSFYWEPQREMMVPLDAPDLVKQAKANAQSRLSELFQLYDLVLECHLKKADKLKQISKLKSSSEFNRIRSYCSSKNVKTSLEVLGAIQKDLGKAVKQLSPTLRDFSDIYVSHLLEMKYFLRAGVTYKEDEDLVIAAVQDLFRLVAMQGYIDQLFVALVHLTENNNESHEDRNGAKYWAIKIMSSFVILQNMKSMYKTELEINPNTKPVDFSTLKPGITLFNGISKTMRDLLIHSGADLRITLIFGESPNKSRSAVFDQEFITKRLEFLTPYSDTIFPGLFEITQPPVSDTQKSLLMDAYQRKIEKFKESNENQTESEEKKLDYKKEAEVYGLWTLRHDVDWSHCALGEHPAEFD